jgi:hypothetical protein
MLLRILTLLVGLRVFGLLLGLALQLDPRRGPLALGQRFVGALLSLT